MNTINDRLIGYRHVYGEGSYKATILETELYFVDGASVHVHGSWHLMLGITYKIGYSGEDNPYTVDSIMATAL